MVIIIAGLSILLSLSEAIIITWLLRKRALLDGSANITRYQLTTIILLTSSAVSIAYVKIGWKLSIIAALLFICFLVIISIIDFWYGLIMQPVIFAMLLVGMIIAITYSLEFLDYGTDRLIGCFWGGGSLFLLAWFTGKMGYGDAWFAAALGLWLGWQALLMLLWLAFLGGGIAGSFLLIAGLKSKHEAIPFGPFLASAGFVIYFYYYELICFIGELWL